MFEVKKHFKRNELNNQTSHCELDNRILFRFFFQDLFFFLRRLDPWGIRYFFGFFLATIPICYRSPEFSTIHMEFIRFFFTSHRSQSSISPKKENKKIN